MHLTRARPSCQFYETSLKVCTVQYSTYFSPKYLLPAHRYLKFSIYSPCRNLLRGLCITFRYWSRLFLETLPREGMGWLQKLKQDLHRIGGGLRKMRGSVRGTTLLRVGGLSLPEPASSTIGSNLTSLEMTAPQQSPTQMCVVDMARYMAIYTEYLCAISHSQYRVTEYIPMYIPTLYVCRVGRLMFSFTRIEKLCPTLPSLLYSTLGGSRMVAVFQCEASRSEHGLHRNHQSRYICTYYIYSLFLFPP